MADKTKPRSEILDFLMRSTLLSRLRVFFHLALTIILLARNLPTCTTLAFRFFRPSTNRRHSVVALTAATRPAIHISDTFCGGNIELLETDVSNNDSLVAVHLNIKKDVFTELEQTHHLQYFSFRSSINKVGDYPVDVTYVIDNASEVSYPSAWQGSTVFYSDDVTDPDSWRRNLVTHYQNGKLVWTHRHDASGSVYFSYFPPYSYQRHLHLIAQCQQAAVTTVACLGQQSCEGRPIECISIGSGDRVAWIIHRQHPGESMAEYFAEGLLHRLVQNPDNDSVVERLLSSYTVYIVPNMCPDGAIRGHLRTNAVGANLNREWADSPGYKAPTPERSPEVLAVLDKMKETGVDLFVDVHGDEELPFNFLSGAEHTNNWGPRLQALHGAFLGAYVRTTSDMQTSVGYSPPTSNADATPCIATNAIANRFNCLSVTLEMPFKDCLSNPDPERGWNPSRSRKLGADLLEPMLYIHPFLRAEENFWDALPPDDAYVTPDPKFTEP